jgi:FtsP/CotA-like multicopper oxidase with cupredoxin domain
MNRRAFIAKSAAAAALGLSSSAEHKLLAQASADVRLEIAALKLEIAPGKHVETIAYNGQVPGPLIRWPEGKPIAIDVVNRTSIAEIVHWPRPSGLRWYHTHTAAGHDFKKGLYTGQFGCFYIDPKDEPGAYDQEVFLTLHDWNAYMGAATDASMDASYDYSTINDRMLGHAPPIEVKQNQRVVFRIVNASATVTHWLGIAGHEMTVVAMDGNPVPAPSSISALRLAPAERADVVVEMNNPGVWIFGETREDFRKAGMGVVLEYAGRESEPKWLDAREILWDYRPFAHSEASTIQPDHQIPLLFESKFRGHGDFDYWTINGKSYPKTDTVTLQEGKRYRLVMRNKSSDDHPVHLHRHTFEVTSLDGKPMSGLRKDVIVVRANSTAEVDFVAANPGATLFHCHQQSHMDFGFMMLFCYA